MSTRTGALETLLPLWYSAQGNAAGSSLAISLFVAIALLVVVGLLLSTRCDKSGLDQSGRGEQAGWQGEEAIHIGQIAHGDNRGSACLGDGPQGLGG